MKSVYRAAALLIVILTAGCSAASEKQIEVPRVSSAAPHNSGVVVDKSEGRVLLVQSVDRKDLLGGQTQKIIEENNDNAIWVRIPAEDYVELSAGDMIKYSSTGPSTVDTSMPAQTQADHVELLSSADWNDKERVLLEKKTQPKP